MRRNNSERGATLITVALALVVLLSFLALSVDIGVGYAERRKMQNAADAAAMAGAQALGQLKTDDQINTAINEYLEINEANRTDSAVRPSTAKWTANGVAGCNIGTPGCTKPVSGSGIQVTARGSAPAFFTGVLGITQLDVAASAAAEFAPVDVVLVIGRPNTMDDDSCSLRPYFVKDAPCNRFGDGYPGKVSEGVCDNCKGAWFNGQCYWNYGTVTTKPPKGQPTPTPGPPGPLMDPAPAECGTVNTQTACTACAGVWTSPDQPLSHAKSAAVSFVSLSTNPRLVHMSMVQYYGSCAHRGTPALTFEDNYATVKSRINSLGVGGQPSNIACAIQAALNEFELTGRPGASKFILLFSDGITNVFLTNPLDLNSGDKTTCKECTWPGCCPQAIAAIDAQVQRAINMGVHISVVGLGSVADTAFLQSIASRTDPDDPQMYWSGRSPARQADLEAIYRHMVQNYRIGLTQ